MPLAVNFWMLAEVANLDFSRQLSQISCPTLLIKSRRDPFLSAAEAEEMTQKIKDVKLIVLPEKTHFLASRFQEKILKVIVDWLKEKSIL